LVAAQIVSGRPGKKGMTGGQPGMMAGGPGGAMGPVRGMPGASLAAPGRRQLEGGAVDDSWASDLFEERGWDFGTVRRGERLTHSFRLTNNLDQIVQIRDVRVSAAFLTARASGKQLAPGASATINVQMDTSRFSGDKTSSIYVQFDQPWQAEVQLLVQADSRDNAPIMLGETLGRDSQAKIEQLEKRVDRLMDELAALRKQLSQPGPKD
jgi:Protein of unknown function (DUF1573)